MDPLADKILVISALICFVSLDLINPWWVLVIVAREFLVTSLRLVAADEGVVIAANKWGKAKTVSQIVAIALILVMQYVQELVAMGVLSAFTMEMCIRDSAWTEAYRNFCSHAGRHDFLRNLGDGRFGKKV